MVYYDSVYYIKDELRMRLVMASLNVVVMTVLTWSTLTTVLPPWYIIQVLVLVVFWLACCTLYAIIYGMMEVIFIMTQYDHCMENPDEEIELSNDEQIRLMLNENPTGPKKYKRSIFVTSAARVDLLKLRQRVQWLFK